MTELQLQNVSLSYPVMTPLNQSVLRKIVETTIGGHINVPSKGNVAHITALDDITLHLKKGARVALIGTNGSGKTTLLKVMAKIYPPQLGTVSTSGTVVPILNNDIVADHEATGYENILQQGLYLGMKKTEIKENIENIAEISGLGAYLHMPLRVYSAGMRSRLSFAICTSMRPDILLVDEGIGMGDQQFFERAAANLEKFFQSSGILVLTSHSAPLLREFCETGIVLRKGKMIFEGDLEPALDFYVESLRNAEN
jgi:ABC-2 type transport system ATP-binding protein